MAADSSPSGLRERTRLAVQQGIADVAVRLFLANGFDEVTVDAIAREAGISPRSFFRYFATKEDVVLGGVLEAGRRVEHALIARPEDEPAWTALREALSVLVDEPVRSHQDELGLARMCITSPSLRAREVEKQAEWDTLLAPHLRARLSPWPAGSTAPDPRPSAIVAATLACLHAATVAWVATDGDSDLVALFDEALRAVRQ